MATSDVCNHVIKSCDGQEISITLKWLPCNVDYENVDYEFVKELQDELMCSICMKVLNEPQMVNCCEQRFCICVEKGFNYILR